MKFKSKPNLAFQVDGNMKSFDSKGFYETDKKEEITILKKTDGVTTTTDKKEKDVKNG
jgi:hypothetical protein